MKKKIIAIAIVALFAVGVPSAAFAYGGPPASQSATNPAPGDSVTITWPIGTFFSLEADLLPNVACGTGSATVLTPPPFVSNADGSYTLQLRVPADNYGSCAVTVVGQGSGTATATLTQLAADLPHTGFDATPVAWIGGTALALGLLIAFGFAARRRSASKE